MVIRTVQVIGQGPHQDAGGARATRGIVAVPPNDYGIDDGAGGFDAVASHRTQANTIAAATDGWPHIKTGGVVAQKLNCYG